MFSSNDTKLYDTLGVGKTATESEIKRSYKKMALKYHPDRNRDPAAEGKFKEIAKAYEVLGDTEKRKNYDMFGLEGVNRGSFTSDGGNPFDVFSDIFGGPSFGTSRSKSKSKKKGLIL